MNSQPAAPSLTFLMTVEVEVGEVFTVGRTDKGIRRMVPILGGTFEGPELKGEVLPYGEDFQLLRSETASELSARYLLRTDDGELIAVQNHAIRSADADVLERLNRDEPVDPSLIYFRCTPTIEGSGELSWLQDRLIIGTGERRPRQVIVHFFVVE